MKVTNWHTPLLKSVPSAVAAGVLTMLTVGDCAMAADEIVVVNKGIGGNSTRDGLRRFQRDVIDVAPDHLVMYFSMNDALNSGKLVPLAEFRDNLQMLIDQARVAGIESLVLVTPNPIVGAYVEKRHPKHPEKDLDRWLSTFDQAIREIATANQIPLADLRKRVLDHCPNVEARESLVRNTANQKMTDGVHLTADGYRVMGELVAETLGDRVKPGQCVVCFGDSITYGAGMKGAGSSDGETYPAWLKLILNKKFGTRQEVGVSLPAVLKTDSDLETE